MFGSLHLGVDRLFDGKTMHHNVVVHIDNGLVTAINTNQVNDGSQPWLTGVLAPGFVDIQVNGGGDVLVNDQPTTYGIAAVVSAHQQYGTTALLPTVITDSFTTMLAAADAVAELITAPDSGVIGIHFEGPHISEAKKGAHNQDYIRAISSEEWALFGRDDLGVKLLTIAPEQLSLADIAQLKSLGVILYLGHSNASYQQASAAFKAGASGSTHLFNAMSALQGREPGLVGATLLDEHAFAGIIVDGHHVDYATVKLAFNNLGAHRLALVTDAMPTVGGSISGFNLVGNWVEQQGSKLIGSNGELAGSVLTMAQAVRNCVVNIGLSVEDALTMATSTPAAAVGLAGGVGQLVEGGRADMVYLDNNVELQQVWRSGIAVMDNDSPH
ncbi:N-acetylglucosamine-6-phosphate deacetylase [Ferrimonas lipolytica]|uniref:N-acetylgalactosamine-6-phosphate deacetylase n=1 Tax=Ferrimonas lipolytica TaxID=2724191 RepID=A0A6H1UA75_9GAMM|nr:N-acetylglucosamine-6-phosphate deacetylase [Ferrimonas lipolytica]QIZ75934.1 N-acetylglucosamine-6-phosphate deacetylase [Ferrimonas lipolytica]